MYWVDVPWSVRTYLAILLRIMVVAFVVLAGTPLESWISFTSSGRMRSKQPVASLGAISIGVLVRQLCSIASWTLFRAPCVIIPLLPHMIPGGVESVSFHILGMLCLGPV